ncbi:MAG: FAD:protein FMN transferase [Candidatus Dormibacteraeota bacterium]|nr:FAD:protein FMN transferase [Candidatus Dormibacteraeota bacterium]
MQLESLSLQALGTSCQLFGVGIAPGRLVDAAAWIGSAHRRLTRFDPNSELSELNAAAGRWRPVSPILESVLRESLRAHTVSGGLVHAGVLSSMLAAGYSRPFREGLPSTTVVMPGERALPPLPEILELCPGSARVRSGYGVDLGGIAKGWMADQLADTIGGNCLINLGGDLFARGSGPQGAGWPVGFGGTTLLLQDQGAATSGTRYRRWGDGLHHLIDPRTGRPSASNLEEVSVLASSAADAEVLAKTALLLGRAAAECYLPAHSDGWWLYP